MSAIRVIQFTDPHLFGDQSATLRGVNTLETLERTLVDASGHLAICDAILVTGDITDAGLATEWAEFIDALQQFPNILPRVLIIPGNHDLNVVSRANPAQFDLPTSPYKRLRKLRTLSAINALQGSRVRVVDRRRSGWGSRRRLRRRCRIERQFDVIAAGQSRPIDDRPPGVA